jgi:hypothetical protein
MLAILLLFLFLGSTVSTQIFECINAAEKRICTNMSCRNGKAKRNGWEQRKPSQLKVQAVVAAHQNP